MKLLVDKDLKATNLSTKMRFFPRTSKKEQIFKSLPLMMRMTRISRGRGTVNFTTHPVLFTPLKMLRKIRIQITAIPINTLQLNSVSVKTYSPSTTSVKRGCYIYL